MSKMNWEKARLQEKVRQWDREAPKFFSKSSDKPRSSKPRTSVAYEMERRKVVKALRAYDGDFEFLVDMKRKVGCNPLLSWKQIAAVKRCLKIK